VTAAGRPPTRQGVHAAGWGGLGAVDAGDIPSGVLIVGEVPHDWLFPRCTAVVHHGGAGALPTVSCAPWVLNAEKGLGLCRGDIAS